jgi:acetyl-CoA carboxylase biotin carboxyl carrier protein
MNDRAKSFSDEEIQQLTALIETLERSTFDYVHVELGELKVTIGKGTPPAGGLSGGPARLSPQPALAPRPVPVKTVQESSSSPVGDTDAIVGTVAIVAPMMGRFYAKPEPKSEPYVTVGAEVSVETTVCLIEVMKIYTSVSAGTAGVIVEVCVRDGEVVEYGQTLFRVRPGL